MPLTSCEPNPICALLLWELHSRSIPAALHPDCLHACLSACMQRMPPPLYTINLRNDRTGRYCLRCTPCMQASYAQTLMLACICSTAVPFALPITATALPRVCRHCTAVHCSIPGEIRAVLIRLESAVLRWRA